MKFVVRPHHMISLGGYIIEWDVSFRNLIVVNKTQEPIKIEIPVLNDEWIEEHRDLGLEVIPVYDEDSFLRLWKKSHLELEKIRS